MKSRKFVILICVLLVLALAAPFSYAWLVDTLSRDANIESYVHKSYFESGNGTSANQYQTYDSNGDPVIGTDPSTGEPYDDDEGCAFEIKYPVQLYYFAWLQYLGYFNRPTGENSTTIDQVYFYISADLDMTGWVLPPVGTSQYPFVGNLDGNGHVISNLTVQNVATSGGSNTTTLTDNPVDDFSGAEIIGFFGVVGSLNSNGTVNAAIENGAGFTPSNGGYTYSSAVNEIKDFALANITIKTETNRALAGIVAGYVNGPVSNVRVGNTGSIVKTGSVSALSYTTNLSDYTLLGYVTDDYKDTSDVVLAKVDTPTESASQYNYKSQGNTAGWGGSIDMYGLLKRLDAVRRVPESATNQAERLLIPMTETHIVDPVTGTTTVTVDEYYSSDTFRSENNNYTATGGNRLYYFKTDEAGSYRVIPYDSGNRHRNYLVGLSTYYNNTEIQQGKKVTTITYKTSGGDYVYLDAYDYQSNGNYLNLTQNGLAGGNAASSHWILDNSGHLYTVTDSYEKVYLNATNTIATGATGTTQWTWSNNKLTYTYNNVTYCLYYNNGWTVSPESYYVITDGNGNYLRYNNNAFSNTRDVSQASHWTFSNANALSGYISLEGTNTYLRYNNGLDVYTGINYTTNATSWTNSGGSLYNGNNYIRFNGTNWVAGPRGTFYAIRNGTNYLNITDANGTTATLGTGAGASYYTDANGNTLWSFSTAGNNPSGTISAVVDGVTYYLNDNNGALTATTSASTSWGNDGTSINHGIECLTYDNGWKLVEVNTLAIKSGNYYLNITNANNATTATLGTGNSVATGSVSNHTVWNFSDSGQIYAIANGRTYYLRNNNGTLQATTTDFTGWTVNGDVVSNGDYYLNYSSGWRVSTQEILGYTIDYNGNYLNLTSTSTTQNNPIGTGTSLADVNDNGHTVWTFENTGTYPSGRMSVKINGTTYYLYGNSRNSNNQLRIATNPTATYANWTNNNGVLSVRSRYLRYDRGWQHSATNSNNVLNFTPVYGDIPTVSFEAGGGPSVSATSVTEPANSQPEQIHITGTTLTRSAVSGLRDFTVSDEVVEPSGIPSYIPLATQGTGEEFIAYSAGDSTDIFNVANGNTGYITGGAYDIGDNRRGDVRISAYTLGNNTTNHDSNSLRYSYTPANGFSHIYTIYGSANNYRRGEIVWDDNDPQDNGSCTAAGITAYKNFKKSKAQLIETLTKTYNADQSVYGIHFMRALISMDHIITADYAVMDGVGYTDFELPEDAIDFSVHQKGLITFYAGTYHNNNNSLFSLHHVIRSDENKSKIEDIKEIQHIYSSGIEKDPYIYMYTDGTYSDGATHTPSNGMFTYGGKTYSLVFNCEWLWDDPGLISGQEDRVYYFEIPVNKGEYALGSVDGGIGAYLIYLDIAANSQIVYREAMVEDFEETVNTYEFPVGATFQNSDIPADNTDVIIPSALAELGTSASGTTVTVTSDTAVGFTAGTANYIKDGVSVTVNGTPGTLTFDSLGVDPVATATKKIRRIRYYDYNVAMDRYTLTEVVLTQIGSERPTMTINAWNTGSDWDITAATGVEQIAEMTEGILFNVGSDTESVPINTGASQTLDYVTDEATSVSCYLINVGSSADAQTLRIEEGDIIAALPGVANDTLLYHFTYAIKDNDDETNGATIDYGYTCDVTIDIEESTPASMFDVSGREYDIEVTSTQTVHPRVLADNSGDTYDVSLTTTPAS